MSKQKESKKDYPCLSLFSGIGGFEIGMKPLGQHDHTI